MENTKKKKTGKLLTSHRYNHPPLLHSCPGGFSRSWPYKTCRGAKVGETNIKIKKNFKKKKPPVTGWLTNNFKA
jgi:hypothetical protein